MDKKQRESFMSEQTEFFSSILEKQKKDYTELLSSEFKKAFELLGIDSEKPIEMQELMKWARDAKKREETIKTRIMNKVIDYAVPMIIYSIITGFMFIYFQNQIPVMIRNEKIKISKIIEKDGK